MNNELVSAINRIIELDQTIITSEIDGRLYSRGRLSRIPLPKESPPDPLEFNTLTGLAEFAKVLKEVEDIFFHVESPTSVSIMGNIQPENFNTRFCYAKASTDFKPFAFSTRTSPVWIDLELFVISLQSQFIETDERENIINMLGSVSNEHVETSKEDGFSQSLQIRTGIALRGKVKVENPVPLKPYRTFLEVSQPEGSFILRLTNKNGLQCSLWEADGGLWKHAAMKAIKDLLYYETDIPVLA
jgi:hypothetical protein